MKATKQSRSGGSSRTTCSRLRVGNSPISNRIFAGKCAKDGLTWKAGKEDVTGDVLQAIIDHVTPGHEVDVTVDGVPKYRIRVTEISSENAACSQKLWFAYDPGDGFEEYATEAEARAAAEKALEYYREDAPSDGWSEEATGVCYGKITGWTVETMRKTKPPADELDEDGMDQDGTYWGEWDEICDYGLHSENSKL
jgi:hypothetical protein